MIRSAAEELNLDRVYIIPAGNPYFKKNITPYALRYDMLRETLLQEKDSRFVLSDMEADESKPTYTFETMETLQSAFPGAKIYFLCGADVLAQIHSWKNPERILKVAELAVFSRISEEEQLSRGDTDSYMKNLADAFYRQFPEGRCRLLKGLIPDISSTMVREHVRNGQSVKELVPAAVQNSIEKYQLYKGETDGTNHS